MEQGEINLSQNTFLEWLILPGQQKVWKLLQSVIRTYETTPTLCAIPLPSVNLWCMVFIETIGS